MRLFVSFYRDHQDQTLYLFECFCFSLTYHSRVALLSTLFVAVMAAAIIVIPVVPSLVVVDLAAAVAIVITVVDVVAVIFVVYSCCCLFQSLILFLSLLFDT